jgi:hypothetical protein
MPIIASSRVSVNVNLKGKINEGLFHGQ